MAGKSETSRLTVEVFNRKATHRYFILERFEAGLVLRGTEVKSVRAGKAQISEAFVTLDRAGVPHLHNAHIDEYSHGTDANHPPTRPRALLLHGKEVNRLRVAAEREGMAIVPLRLHIRHGLVKVDIALCRGKQLHDKRQDLRHATEMREAERAIGGHLRGKK
jgi:SsrA-binding protein